MSLWAQLGIQEIILSALRLIVAVGVAFIAWLLLGPLIRLTARLITKRTLPGWAVSLFRAMGGVLAGLLVFYYLPLGFGGSGWGFGPGKGGGPGGGGVVSSGKPGKGKDKPDGKGKEGGGNGTAKAPEPKETLTIEMLGGPRFQVGSGRYYLIARKEPAVTLDDVEVHLKKHKDRLETIEIVLTRDSVSERHVAVSRLRNLADGRYKIPSVVLDLSAK